MLLYRNIRGLREEKGLKQREVAQILNCSQRVYSNYERGNLDIPTDILIRLAHFYNTSVDYLLGLTDRKSPYPCHEKT